MSRGTPVVPVRVDQETMALVMETIQRRNFWTQCEPWSVSDFIRIALREKIAKMARCRRPRRGCITPPSATADLVKVGAPQDPSI